MKTPEICDLAIVTDRITLPSTSTRGRVWSVEQIPRADDPGSIEQVEIMLATYKDKDPKTGFHIVDGYIPVVFTENLIPLAIDMKEGQEIQVTGKRHWLEGIDADGRMDKSLWLEAASIEVNGVPPPFDDIIYRRRSTHNTE